MDPVDYEKIVDRKIDFFTTEALWRSWTDPKLFELVLGMPELALRDGATLTSEWFVSKTMLQKAESLVASQDSARFALHFCQEGEKRGEALLRLSSAMRARDYSRWPADRLLVELEVFDRQALPLLLFLWPTHPVARVIERQLRSLVQSRLSDSAQVDSVVAILSFPSRENTPVVENRDLMKQGSKLASIRPLPASLDDCPEPLRHALRDHAEKYGFLGARGAGLTAWTTEDFFHRALGLAREPDLNAKLHKSSEELSRNAHESADWMGKLGFTPAERQLVAAAKEMVFFRTYRTETMYRAYEEIGGLLSAVGRHLGIGPSMLRQMGFREIHAAVNSGNRGQGPGLASISTRSSRFAIRVSRGKIKVLSDSETATLTKVFTSNVGGVSDVKGTPACSGRIQGVARIVHSAREMGKVRAGDVLLASMTTPDFLPAMQKAAAFVTDEGGITCHAAIVAREMGKPCVIGTKVATKVFKDGDRLDVDGVSGWVRKC